jgi:hypothetical protein
MLMTMPDLSWTVRVDRWTWLYVFSHKGTVRWKDNSNGMGGHGTWHIKGNKLITRWSASKTWEEWDVPINPRAATGKCHMQAGTFDLRAEALNFVELDTITIFTRTPESKTRFLEQCSLASGRVQVAQLQFSAWLSGISIAYGDAFEGHNKLLSDISATVKIADDLLLGAALAFLGGGVGGVVSGVMKAAKASDFMIDAGKDLAKFAVRGPAGAALRSTGIKGMPDSPLQWQNSVNERVMKEMAVVSQIILDWRIAIDSDDPSFDAGFDPDQVVDKALAVDGTRIASLPQVDKASLQKDFEKGWLVAWIEKEAVSNIPFVRDLTRDKLRASGLRLGLNNIDELLDKHCPRIDGFPPGTFTP